MRKDLQTLKKDNDPGIKGVLRSYEVNQITQEIINIALRYNQLLDPTTGDDQDGANLGNIRQCIESIDTATKQILYFDIGDSSQVNHLHLVRHNDIEKLNSESNVPLEKFFNYNIILFIANNSNTSQNCTLRLNNLLAKPLVKVDNTPIDIGDIEKNKIHFAFYKEDIDKYILNELKIKKEEVTIKQIIYSFVYNYLIDPTYGPYGNITGAAINEIRLVSNPEYSKHDAYSPNLTFIFEFHGTRLENTENTIGVGTYGAPYIKVDDLIRLKLIEFKNEQHFEDHVIPEEAMNAAHLTTELKQNHFYYCYYDSINNIFKLHLLSPGSEMIYGKKNDLFLKNPIGEYIVPGPAHYRMYRNEYSQKPIFEYSKNDPTDYWNNTFSHHNVRVYKEPPKSYLDPTANEYFFDLELGKVSNANKALDVWVQEGIISFPTSPISDLTNNCTYICIFKENYYFFDPFKAGNDYKNIYTGVLSFPYLLNIKTPLNVISVEFSRIKGSINPNFFFFKYGVELYRDIHIIVNDTVLFTNFGTPQNNITENTYDTKYANHNNDYLFLPQKYGLSANEVVDSETYFNKLSNIIVRDKGFINQQLKEYFIGNNFLIAFKFYDTVYYTLARSIFSYRIKFTDYYTASKPLTGQEYLPINTFKYSS